MTDVGIVGIRSVYAPKVGDVVVLDFYGNEKFVIGATFAGGMGVVHQLVSVRSGVPVAMKMLQPDADRTLFERECELWLALCTHPNVAQAHAYGIWNGNPVVLIDWYPGTLGEARIDAWKPSEILTLASSLSDALDFAASEMNVVHQDIKPSNILVDDDRLPYLSDFGLARCGRAARQEIRDSSYVTKEMIHTIASGPTGPTGGTPLYMAPELFSGVHPSVGSDVYSLGVTLYEALTREHPYLGCDTSWRFQPRLRATPLRRVVDRLGEQIHPLVEVIVDCLSLNPNARPSIFGDIAYQLGHRARSIPRAIPDNSVDRVVARVVLLVMSLKLASDWHGSQRLSEKSVA